MLKPAELKDIRKEISTIDRKSLEEICGKLIRFKKENKELLSYLLFWSEDETLFQEELTSAITDLMQDVNTTSVFWAKKTIRKIVRHMNRYLGFSGNKITELEVRIHFCEEMKKLSLNIHESKVLVNIQEAQIKKIHVALKSIHEDLQRDYEERIVELSL